MVGVEDERASIRASLGLTTAMEQRENERDEQRRGGGTVGDGGVKKADDAWEKRPANSGAWLGQGLPVRCRSWRGAGNQGQLKRGVSWPVVLVLPCRIDCLDTIDDQRGSYRLCGICQAGASLSRWPWAGQLDCYPRVPNRGLTRARRPQRQWGGERPRVPDLWPPCNGVRLGGRFSRLPTAIRSDTALPLPRSQSHPRALLSSISDDTGFSGDSNPEKRSRISNKANAREHGEWRLGAPRLPRAQIALFLRGQQAQLHV